MGRAAILVRRLARERRLVALVAVVVAVAVVASIVVPRGPDTTTTVALTVSASSEPGTTGLVIRIALDGRGASGLAVTATLPADVVASASGEPRPNVSATRVRWDGSAVTGTAPLAIVFAPRAADGGATVFQQAATDVMATWSDGAGTHETRATLPLNGLWAEDGLRRTVLPTGLTVLTRERPDSTTVSVRVAVRAGGRDEDDRTCGGSHWLEHAHFLGTPTLPNNQAIFGAIGEVGGQSNAATSYEWTDYWHLVPDDGFDIALSVLADQLINSTFRPELFLRERSVVQQEHKLRNDNPSIRSFDSFIPLVFSVSPLRRGPPDPKCLDAISVDQILAYHQTRYVTGNMAVAASGALRHDEAVAKIAAAFAKMPTGPLITRARVPEPIETDLRRLVIGSGNGTAEIRLGWPGPGTNDADAAPLRILEEILGVTGRRLSEDLRDRRSIAAAVSANYLGYSDAGVMLLSATTTGPRVDDVVAALTAQIARVRAGEVSEDDVAASVRAIEGRAAITDEPNLTQTARAEAEVGVGLLSRAESLARLRTVRAADVVRVAKTYLDPAAYTLVVVRP